MQKVTNAIKDVQIVGASDISPGRAEDFIRRHELEDARGFQHHHDLLSFDLDAVSVCTPHAAHFQPAVDALRAGKHVLVEKPLSVTLAEGIQMVEQARKAQKMLSAGFQTRYSVRNITARELVASGRLGRVYYAETASGRRKGIPGGTFVSKASAGGGAILDIGCYSLDTALFILGHPRPLTVTAFTANYLGTSPSYFHSAADFEVEDFGVAMVRLEGGIALVVKSSWAMHMDSLGTTFFLGMDAGLSMTHDTSLRLFHDVSGKSAHSDIALPAEQYGQLIRQKIKAFVEAIRTNGPAPVPADEVLFSQAILDGIYRSAELGREVEIEFPSHLFLQSA